MPTPPVKLSYFGESGEQGLSESWFLKSSVTSLTAALTVAGEIVKRRAKCLASGDSIIWARVALVDPAHQSKAVISGPLEGPPETSPTPSLGRGEVNKVRDSLMLRFETGPGDFAIRKFRSIPDVKILDELWEDAPVDFSGAPASTALADSSDWIDAFIDFIRYVRDNTAHVVQTSILPATFTFQDWDRVMFRRSAIGRASRVFGLEAGSHSH